MMFFEGGFTFANFLVDIFVVFMFILWFWLLITVFSDLFRRKDVSGFGKLIWLILLIVLPYIGVFAYLVSQSRSMAERSEADAKAARDHLRDVVGFSAADEIEKLNKLKASGGITAEEYTRLRAKLV
jgi:predicted membrane channel-forming protein YqfA (hemolysin III family)